MYASRKNMILSAGVSALAMIAATPALSQQADDNFFTLEEIIVTAQKRSQSAQDVPISLSAFGANDLETIAAETIADLEIYTPGLEISGVTQPTFKIRGVQTDDFGTGTDPSVGVYIDGVYSARSGAALIFFSDIERVEILKGPQGTLFGRNSAAGAISIHTKKPSTDEVDAKLKLRYGRWNKMQAEVMVNMPLSDTIAVRANFLHNQRDGYVRDAVTDEKYGEQENQTGRIQLRWEPSEQTAINLTYEFDRTDQDDDSVRIGTAGGMLISAHDPANPFGEATIGDLPGHADVLNAFGFPSAAPLSALTSIPIELFYGGFGYTSTNPNADWDFFHDPVSAAGSDPWGPVSSDIGNGYEQRDLDGVNLKVTHDFDWGTVTLISAYKTFHTENLQEEDGTNQRKFYFDTNNIEDDEHIYEELRFNGVWGDLTWTIGGSYYWEHTEQFTPTMGFTDSIDVAWYNVGATPGILAGSFAIAPPNPSANPCQALFLESMNQFVSFFDIPMVCLGVPALGMATMENLANVLGTSWYGRTWNEDMYNDGRYKSSALFGDFTYAVTDKLNLTLGGRYTHDTKDYTWLNGNRIISNVEELDFPGVGNLADIQQQIMMAVFAGERADTQGDLVFDFGDQEGIPLNKNRTWNNFSMRAVIDYKVNEDLMFFASFAEGYKAGGFGSVEIGSEFDIEEVWNIEFGMKSEWYDNRLRFNTSVWKYKYDNRQGLEFLKLPGSPVPQYVTRTRDISGKGIDVELLWVPTADLRLFANMGYQDVICTDECPIDSAGNEAVGDPQREPKFRISLGGDYTFDLNDMGSLVLHADHSYTTALPDNVECAERGDCSIAAIGPVSWFRGGAKNISNARLTWNDADGKISVSAYGKNIFNNLKAAGAGGLTVRTFGTPQGGVPMPGIWGLDLTWRY